LVPADCVVVVMSAWIEWKGGKRPVVKNECVQVLLRNGAVTEDWRHLPSDAEQDIIAYRVVKP